MSSEASTYLSPTDWREQARTHLFVTAVLSSDAGSAPVRIRNMSPSGALIEAALLPPPGTIVRLKRGSLTAGGRIAWTGNRKAGIAFDVVVFVSDWMSRKPADHQHRVDELMSCFKAGTEPLESSTSWNSGDNRQSIESELAQLKTDLTELGDALAGDMIMVATHPEIQLLDISVQRVDRIMKLLADS